MPLIQDTHDSICVLAVVALILIWPISAQTEVADDLVFLSVAMAASPGNTYIEVGATDGYQVEYSADPAYVDNGPVQEQWLYNNATGKIGNCIMLATEPVFYAGSTTCFSFQADTIPPQTIYKCDRLTKNTAYVPPQYTFALYTYNVGRGMACVKTSAYTRTATKLSSIDQNYLTWDVFINGGRNRKCMDCSPNYAGLNPFYYDISSWYTYDEPSSNLRSNIFGLSMAMSRRTDGYRSADTGVFAGDSAWWLVKNDPFYGPNTGIMWSELNYCISTWVYPGASTARVLQSDSTSIPVWTKEIFVTNKCHRPFLPDVQNTDFSPFSRTAGQLAYYEWLQVCALAKDNYYSVECLSPDFADQIFAEFVQDGQGNGREQMRNKLYNRPAGTAKTTVTDDFPNYLDRGKMQYPSLRDQIKEYYDIRRYAAPLVQSKNAGLNLNVRRPTAVSFIRLMGDIHNQNQDTKLNSKWPQYRDALPANLQSDPHNYVSACPKNANGVVCNALTTNENTCVQSAGICMCDMNHLGIACDIPWPRNNGVRLTEVDVLANTGLYDQFQVCSTAGQLVDQKAVKIWTVNSLGRLEYTTVTIPVCRCMPGFRGLPTEPRDAGFLAAILHPYYVSIATDRRKSVQSGCWSTTHWADSVSDSGSGGVKQTLNVVNISRTATCASNASYVADFPYNQYLMVHQCQIWAPPDLTKPPIEISWDIVGFFFRQPDSNLVDYKLRRQVYPPPSFSGRSRVAPTGNYYATGAQGVQCADYKPGGVSFRHSTQATSPPFYSNIAEMMNWIIDTDPRVNTSIPFCTLYGGARCRCCPDCNRTNSVCTDNPTAYGPAAANAPPVCVCDTNFCGTLCNNPICPMFNGVRCAGNGTCPSFTTSAEIVARCDVVPQAGYFAKACVCNAGFEGNACQIPICPYSNGQMCGGSARGTCNVASRRCDCKPQFGGSACERNSCPKNNVTGLECSGVVIPGTSTSVCDTTLANPVCRCQLTLPDLGFQDTSQEMTENGWPASTGYTNRKIYLDGRWGIACENNYSSICMDSDGRWCGQPVNTDGTAAGTYAGYAGCYNTQCRLDGDAAAGKECKPSCHCTTEYTNPTNAYCGRSNCGPTRCDSLNTTDTGDCYLNCYVSGDYDTQVPCVAPALLGTGSTLELQAICKCKVYNNTIYAQTTNAENTNAACNRPADACYSNSNIPCNGNGRCIYNTTGDTFYCSCNTGFTSANCSIPPACLTPLGQVCTGPTQICTTNGANSAPVCACNRTYLRNESRLCTEERCVSTGGTVQNDGTCKCPLAPFYEDVPYLPTTGNQRYIGCRIGCPVNNQSGIPCGALELTIDSKGFNILRTRCSDLFAGVPVFGNSGLPAPYCLCNFRGNDYLGNLNYFINDTSTPGGCTPKCNPSGLCKGIECAGMGTLTSSNGCRCSPNFEGEFCQSPKCSRNPQLFDQTTCQCRQWCLTGDACQIDICATTSGGQCLGDSPNDCNCDNNPYLKLNVSGDATSRRQCESRCENGATLNSGRTACLCPAGYTGDFCQTQVTCPIQYSGIYCNVSLCANGGTPLPLEDVGCTCTDDYYQGYLCNIDNCGTSVNTQRLVNGSCVCSAGFSGDLCALSNCGVGGVWNPASQACNCYTGYNLAPNNTACIIDSSIQTDCLNGRYRALSTGGFYCSCLPGWTGVNCNTTACTPPLVALYQYDDGTVVCACPPSTKGSLCSQSLCTSHATGSYIDQARNLTICDCVEGYVAGYEPVDGVFQCVPPLLFCSYDGSATIDYNAPGLEQCTCKEGYSGLSCDQIVEESTEEDVASLNSTYVIVGIAVAVFILAAVVAGFIILVKNLMAPTFVPNGQEEMEHSTLLDKSEINSAAQESGDTGQMFGVGDE